MLIRQGCVDNTPPECMFWVGLEPTRRATMAPEWIKLEARAPGQPPGMGMGSLRYCSRATALEEKTRLAFRNPPPPPLRTDNSQVSYPTLLRACYPRWSRSRRPDSNLLYPHPPDPPVVERDAGSLYWFDSGSVLPPRPHRSPKSPPDHAAVARCFE